MVSPALESLSRPASDLLVQYAGYHRDARNIASHFVGIPLIVLALGVLMARLPLAGGGAFTLAGLAWALSTAWYLRRGLPLLGVATAAVNGLLIAAAHPLAAGSAAAWLGWGLGLFVVGWVVQFVGHGWEGRKPAFVDDIVGLLVGPMFIVAEALLALGWRPALAAEITQRAGPVRRPASSRPAAR